MDVTYNKFELALLEYLQEHPGWHRASALIRNGFGGRVLLFPRLERLEAGGYVKRRSVEKPFFGWDTFEFHATGKQLP